MTITAQDLVRREVIHCVSSLVHTLAEAQGSRWRVIEEEEIHSLTNQAYELASPVLDYEEAAREAGWVEAPCETAPNQMTTRTGTACGGTRFALSAQEACELDGIEPYEREVYEHWIVSNWLADKLIEKGEKVDKDFQGMCVWARTTTGQAIYVDGVIEEIVKDLSD